MKERFLKSLYAIAILFGFSSGLHGQQPGDVLTVDQVVNEAITHNLDFFAQKYDLSIAEAQIVTAKLRPNPLLTLDADHLDLLGTGFSLTAPPGKMPNNEDRKNMPVALTIFRSVAGSGRPAPYSQWEDVMSPVLDWPIPFVV